MAINKLPEFAKDGQKNTDDLVLTDGFPVLKKPARQWFNWLFNTLTAKINEIIDADFVARNEIVNNLTTADATKPLSAAQGEVLQDSKLGKTENAVSSSKLETVRTVSFSGAATGSFNFDGSGNSSCVLALANSGVVASTYGAALKIPVLTVNAKGLITGVSEQNIPIVDDLTTNDSTKPISARQAKLLQDNKLDKTALNNTLTSTSIEQALTAAQGKVLLGMFASSHTQNGYQKIANPLDPSKPLIIQWGKPGIINSGTTINFPIAFPSQVFIVIASDHQGNAVIGTSDWTLTNFKSRSGGPIAYNWFAIGN